MSLPIPNKIIYYESRIQYRVITVVLSLFFFSLTLSDDIGLSRVSIYFLLISLVANFLTLFYRPSVFEISDSTLTIKKGSSKIVAPWSEVLAIHYDWAPSTMNAHRGYKSNAFFIETKSGFSKYTDKANIKRHGAYTFRSMGGELISEIIKRSSAIEKTGEVSIFKQTQKFKDILYLFISLFFVPIIIFAISCLVYGPI